MGIFDRLFPWRTPPIHLNWLQVEVSARCNASCSYCATSCAGERGSGGLMDMETFERLSPGFSFAGLVFLQGWGEPLLHPDFWEMLRRAKAAGAKTGFTTNATQLDRERRERLVDSGADVVAVSLAGATPETQARFREGCDLTRIDEAMVALKQLKQDRGVRVPDVHIAFILLRSNWREIGGVVELAARWDVSQIVVSPLAWIRDEAAREESMLEDPAIWPEVTAALVEAHREAAARGIQFNYEAPGVIQNRAMCPENVLKSCFVSYRGDVSPCAFAAIDASGGPAVHYFQGQKHEVERIVFGNVREEMLPAIWHSRKARAFRRSFLKRKDLATPGSKHLQGSCRHCYKILGS